jgi:hypothetical protein
LVGEGSSGGLEKDSKTETDRQRERERETTGTHDEKRSLTVGRHVGGHADGVDRGDYTAEHVLGARDVRMVH